MERINILVSEGEICITEPEKGIYLYAKSYFILFLTCKNCLLRETNHIYLHIYIFTDFVTFKMCCLSHSIVP